MELKTLTPVPLRNRKRNSSRTSSRHHCRKDKHLLPSSPPYLNLNQALKTVHIFGGFIIHQDVFHVISNFLVNLKKYYHALAGVAPVTGAGLGAKGSPVRFPVRAHACVVG